MEVAAVTKGTVRSGDDLISQFDSAQALKASTALLRHLKADQSKSSQRGKRNLLAAGDGDEEDAEHTAEALWCVVTTKKHIVDQKRLKPSKILLPHTLNKSSSTSICLITPDPQRTFKDVLENPLFPRQLAAQVRILGVTKLKQRYKSFEARRQLHAQYDVFLADDRVITLLPRLLGKIFYESSKRPVPVRVEAQPSKDASGKKVKQSTPDAKSVLPAAAFAREIEKTLSSARVHLSPSVTTAVQVGWSNFTSQQVAENVQAVVEGMVGKLITKGWNNVRAIHIKAPNSAALPIWMSQELWVDENDVLEEDDAERARQIGRQKGTKRKGRELEIEDDSAENTKRVNLDESAKDDKSSSKKQSGDSGFSKEMLSRREALRQQKREARHDLSQQAQEQKKVSNIQKDES